MTKKDNLLELIQKVRNNFDTISQKKKDKALQELLTLLYQRSSSSHKRKRQETKNVLLNLVEDL